MILNPFTGCKNIDSKFYDKVLNDFDTNSYFIALNIKSPYYKGRVIIENYNLYRYLNKSKGFNKEGYLSFMKRLLIHNKILKINNNDFPDWKFIKVLPLERVIQIAGRGKNNFVAHYFNGVVLNYGITDLEKNAVIDQLFYWQYPSRIDRITGELIIG
jgi:hypothetical protein